MTKLQVNVEQLNFKVGAFDYNKKNPGSLQIKPRKTLPQRVP